ncbi:ATP-grasp domain-containing protein [Microbacterium sp. NEAU-LLB]|uniref:biotin carboxylase n=2 Tax=Microbacterium stercoris TaxID=2820289 RepID=A0A939TYQ3_9MICO|nr:ATP-grasp domain-containing protein [Microbacterium stercoris]
MFDTVLIANRGEIALRIIRTLDRMGIASVAVYSDADARAPHVRAATTAVRIGPADARRSYLDGEAVIAAAIATGAQAVHPGYGFLSENAAFARACADAGLVFIGPSPAAIDTMGDKIRAREAVESRGVATVPGIARPGLDDPALIAGADEVGYPVLVKPSAGGGGKGMHRVDDPRELPAALAQARREAAAAFGDDTLFIERFVAEPRHVEVQVLADAHGAVIHLGERECSLQRRHQKVIEEAPSPLLDEAQRAAIGRAACETARAVGYTGAGTVEFIVSAAHPDEPFFMEMNTRLQVEHPVTELVTGVDLVEQQLRVAAGQPLALAQADVRLEGHAIEARIYAEDPAAGFLPTGGRLIDVRWPRGVRVDAGVEAGTVVGADYDPMLAKVIAHGADRDDALAALDGALAETRLPGVVTNVRFLRRLLALPAVVAGALDTGIVDREAPALAADPVPDAAFAACARHDLPAATGAWRADGWRLTGARGAVLRYADGEGTATVTLDAQGGRARVERGGVSHEMRLSELAGVEVLTDADGAGLWVLGPDGDRLVVRSAPARRSRSGSAPGLASPMPGTVVAVHVADGAEVEEGAAVVSVEAMKMEHVLRAPLAGVVALSAVLGQTVTRGQELAAVTPRGEGA